MYKIFKVTPIPSKHKVKENVDNNEVLINAFSPVVLFGNRHQSLYILK